MSRASRRGRSGMGWELENEPFTAFADFEKKRYQAIKSTVLAALLEGKVQQAFRKRELVNSRLQIPLVSLSLSTTPEIPSAAPTLWPPRATVQLAVQKFFRFHFHWSCPLFPRCLLRRMTLLCRKVWRSRISKLILLLRWMSLYRKLIHKPWNPLLLWRTTTLCRQPTFQSLNRLHPRNLLLVAASCIDTNVSSIQDPEHTFDFSMRPSHLNRISEQFGVLSQGDHCHLPLIPNLNELDMASTGDAPPSGSRNSSPANFLSTSFPDYISPSPASASWSLVWIYLDSLLLTFHPAPELLFLSIFLSHPRRAPMALLPRQPLSPDIHGRSTARMTLWTWCLRRTSLICLPFPTLIPCNTHVPFSTSSLP